METNFDNIVYSKNVIEFVTVANEFCIFIEKSDKFNLYEYSEKLQKFLPLIYLKSSMLPSIDAYEDVELEKYVTEVHYNKILMTLQSKFSELDSYKDIFDTLMNENDEFSNLNISEDLTDLYQDLKDFIVMYRMGDIDIMNNAIWECKNNFELYWGHRLLSCLRIIHIKLYKFSDLLKKNTDEI